MYNRRPIQRKPRTSQIVSFPAPTGGWISNQNLAQPGGGTGAKPPQGAEMLENYFPTATSAILRRGSTVDSVLGDGSAPVTSLFSYINGAQEEFFGATEDSIYDITVSETQVLAGQTGGDWSVIQFATAGGTFLRGVNGEDTPFVYDGTTWGLTPAITGAVPENLDYVWAFKNRLFFIEKESLDAWYLPVDAIGGAAVKFPMGGVFSRGGSLLFGTSWSLDAGSGLTDTCIFVTTEGEVAVYQGADPSSSTDWAKVGVYRIGRPLGKKAFIRAGGDLIIATTIGFVPLSQAIQRDFAALAPSAVSFPIEVAWNEAVEKRSSLPWHCEVWPSKQMVVFALPTVNEQPPVMFVANSRTGAWAKFTNWDGTCLEVFKERLFFGSADGKVVEANVSGLDQGLPYTASYVPLFDDLGTPANLKNAQLARAIVRTAVPVEARLSIQTDFQINLPIQPDAPNIPQGNEWGNAIWGQSIWGGSLDPQVQQDWQSVNGLGYAVAAAVQLTSGSIVPLDTELIRVDMTYTMAEIVT